MQVATLFRESSTLLGATMESGGGGVGGTPESGVSNFGPGPLSFENNYNHPVAFTNNKYKMNMKMEPNDEEYDPNPDMLLGMGQVNQNNHEVKCEPNTDVKMEDPYSFIDEDPISMLPNAGQQPQQPHQQQQQPQPHPQQHPLMMQQHQMSPHPMADQLMPGPKKRGRKKKIKTEGEMLPDMNGGIPRPIKERKKHDRFNGMPEEEVCKRTLPDHLTENLDIIIIGINPGLFAAYKGHHYAGPGNHFWKCLYLSGLTTQQMSADEDYKLLQVGIGFTNMVERATKGSADLTRKEIKEGSQILLEKLRKFRPKIAVFNGKLIYEVFSGKKDFKFGRQPDLVEGTNTHIWVMPSSSARCAQLPRAADKVPFYSALKKFRDYLNGLIPEIDESEMVFSEPTTKSCYEAEPKGDLFPTELTDISNAVIKNEDGTIVPCKKKRGRPKKIKVEGEESPPKPVVRKAPPQTQNNNCDFPKKKRGRPKKVKIENMELNQMENNTSTNMSQCYPNQSPIQSPNNYYQMTSGMNVPPNKPGNMYPQQNPTYSPQHPPNYSPQHPQQHPNYSQSPGPPYSQSPRPPYSQSPRPPYNQSPRPPYSQSPKPNSQTFSQSPRPPYSQSPRPTYSQSPRPQYSNSPRPPYSQSPRPHSQPFTHSDLSSEISAAISSEQLGSPASPIGPPDFEPPTSMAEDAECRLSPAASTNSEQTPHHYYHQQPYTNMDTPQGPQYNNSPRQDIASKSLSGLESLVDQIPSIAEGDTAMSEAPEQYSGQFNTYNIQSSRASPAPYYSPGSGYPIYPTPTWSGYHEPMPPIGYPQIPYAQSYGPGIHVPSPNYPYYSYPQPSSSHPPYPPYLGGF